MDDLTRFIDSLNLVLGTSRGSHPLLIRSTAILRALNGEDISDVARDTNLPRYHLSRWVSAVRSEGFYQWLGKVRPDERRLRRARQGIAQMMLGSLAEEHFETLAADSLKGEFTVKDDRVGRTDTDYRLMDHSGRQVCRFNIKFHGTLFREAHEYVGLDPDDCFALATYKIHAALRRQEEERLPYVFLIVSVPAVPRAALEEVIPDQLVWLSAVTNRAIEEGIVTHLLGQPSSEDVRRKVQGGEFRVLSARRAYVLLRDQLFARVHALRVPRFTNTFGRADINMHFSLRQEMIPFREFLGLLATTGVQGISVRLERGEV